LPEREAGRYRVRDEDNRAVRQFDAQRLVPGVWPIVGNATDVSVAEDIALPSSSVHWPGCSKSSGM